MMIEAKKLLGLPLAAEDALSRIGTLKQIVIDPENGQVLGFLVATGFLLPTKIISTMDIRFWDKNGLVTEYEENLVPYDEIVRIKNIVEQNINLLEMSAETENGKALGVVEDILIDTDNAVVVKYYLCDLLGKSRIFSAEKVLRIDKKIIFSDDEATLKEEVNNSVVEAQIAS